ncbi:MAG: hypothetical protein V2I57_05915 [Xanthomonadales bacterium]|nr:hypothetical protein [Xanthomonadales bacterium]
MKPILLDGDALVRRFRRRGWLRALLEGAAAGMAAGALASFGGSAAPIPALAAAIVALCTVLLRAGNSRAIRADRQRVAEHLDRRFSALEESARLLLEPAEGLTPVQRLQRARIEATASAIGEHPERWLPPLRALPLLIGIAAGAVAWWGAPALRDAAQPAAPGPGERAGAQAFATTLPTLRDIEIVPPAYTALPALSETQYDVTLPEGAAVTWRLEDPVEAPLRLVLSDGSGTDKSLLLGRGPDGLRQGTAVVQRSSLYRFERLDGTEIRPLPGVHTLTVTLDRAPRLRVRTPAVTAVEVPPEGPVTVDYRVDAEDDYGIGPAEIRASVAKGSGEGVKFRDAVFGFDAESPLEGGKRLERQWNLRELGMEPGDEVYFFTVARDNRPDDPNESRSDTVVVRWLDEAPEPLLAEGLAMDVLPDYFKSQRQIIIETEQLIADRDSLAREEFDDLSRALGQAQSDLKGRYGQYLGDEFEEGGSPFGAGDGEEDPADAGEDHDHDHDHDHGDDAPTGPDTSGSAADLVARFMHDHGAADIGPITRRNPVGLMKRSIANMWQAELFLRLSNPEEALPYEYEALKYLNLARQADRIYTRRLGFEPPPVTEERRLTGELDEIESRIRRESAAPDPDSTALIAALQAWLATRSPSAPVDENGRLLLRQAATEFTRRSAQRPALIRQAATLEKMLLAGRLEVPGCPECLDRLRQATWSLLPPATPAPAGGRRPPVDDLGRAYREASGSLEAREGPP